MLTEDIIPNYLRQLNNEQDSLELLLISAAAVRLEKERSEHRPLSSSQGEQLL